MVPADTIMERSIRSGQVEGEGDMLRWWKWITSLLALLSYSVLVMMWMPGKFSGIQSARAFFLGDQALLSALNLSTSSGTISTACENFLLAGERENRGSMEPEKVPVQGWSDGEWHHPPESSDFDWLQQPRTMGGSVGDHGASFSVRQATRGLSEWSSSSEKTPVQAVEGVLELRNVWDWNPSMEAVMFAESSGAKVDFNQMLAMQNLKVFLSGAFVDTAAGRRLCMTGCAYRIDRSYQIDCGFNLKMTYPSRQATTATRPIEAELSRRSTRSDDPLRFPAVLIQKDIVAAEYTSKITYLRSALDQKNVNYNAHLRRPSTVEAAEQSKFHDDYDDDTYSGYH